MHERVAARVAKVIVDAAARLPVGEAQHVVRRDDQGDMGLFASAVGVGAVNAVAVGHLVDLVRPPGRRLEWPCGDGRVHEEALAAVGDGEGAAAGHREQRWGTVPTLTGGWSVSVMPSQWALMT